MVRNQTIPTSVTSSVSAELSTSLRQTISRQHLSALEQLIALPNSLGSFAWLLLGVVVVCAGLTLHILLSVQIYQIRQQVSQLQGGYQAIERQNAELVWSITQHSSLSQIQARALALGYEVPGARHYVALPASAARNQPTPSAISTSAADMSAPVAQAPSTHSLFDQLKAQAHTITRWWQR